MKFPKVRGERLIIIALSMILLAEVVSTIWNLESAGADRRFQLQFFLSNSLQNVGFLLLIVSLITTAIRKMRREGLSFTGIAMLLVGLVLCAIPLLSVQMYREIDKSFDENRRPNFLKMENMMKKGDLPDKARCLLSKMYAQDKYLYDGVIVTYLTEDGKEIKYVPTKEDIEFNNLNSVTTQRWQKIAEGLPAFFWSWVGITVLSLMVGVLSPIRTTPSTGSKHGRA